MRSFGTILVITLCFFTVSFFEPVESRELDAVLAKKEKPTVDRPRLHRTDEPPKQLRVAPSNGEPINPGRHGDDKPRLFVDGEIHPDYAEAPQTDPITTNPVYEYIGQPDDDAWPAEGLGPCQADCDNHGQCREGLQCFQRQGSEHVPGCSGTPVDGEDYCYDPNTAEPSTSPSAAPSGLEPTVSPEPSPPPTTAFPSGSPSTSMAPTKTPEPSPYPSFSSAPSLLPSASPTQTAAPTSSPSLEPTTEPSEVPTAMPTRVDLIILPDSEKPFDKCVGQCQTDDDCLAHYVCQERGGNEFVPGCEGMPQTGINYCFDRRDGAAPPAMPKGSFRLRLYWERGYFWQETFAEAKWCLMDSNPPEVKKCGSGSTKYEFVYLSGEGDQIKVSGRDRCLDRTGNNGVSYQPCDPNDVNQRWKGNWASRRFDIRSPINHKCFTQHHHPKSGEIVSLWDCDTAHRTDTGFWNVY